MPNIYKLGDDYLMLANRLADTADEDGVIDTTLLPVVSEAKELVESKAASIGCVVKEISAYKAQIDDEIKRLTAMSKTLGNRIDYLTGATSAVLQACGIERVNGVHAVILFRRSEQTVIDDESELPDEYTTTKITVTPDKTKIKNAIKAGQAVPGARLVEKLNIQIK
ncbi:MAG: siphovirus Gp157 family protein [Clostridiales bacterium]|nr:siphovirus Gp157 family protein [Clostridiales bacterium]